MRTIEWEIKVSKLCNLRCTYCYEFDELDDKRRISLDGWRAILKSTQWYQHEIERRFPGEEIKTRYVWHGGEPLLLPLSYYREVLQLQREILGAENVGTRYTNHVPTNLYTVPPETLKFLKDERFQIAVSFDAIAGVRVLASGAPTEDRVLENLERLLADGWRVGCNVVLAAHTAPHLTSVYDSIRDTVRDSNGGLYLNIIPLHGTPTDNGATPFSIGADQIVDALHKVLAEGRFALIADVCERTDDGGECDGLNSEGITRPGFVISDDSVCYDALRLLDFTAPTAPRQIRVFARAEQYWLVSYCRRHTDGDRLFWGSIDWQESIPTLREINSNQALTEALFITGIR